MSCLMIMAGGTGGHVMPALAVAEKLRQSGVQVVWMGTQNGLEYTLVPKADIELDIVNIRGLRQSGLKRKLMMPIMLLFATVQALLIIIKRRPDCMLGMGGFVSGPGGIAAAILRRPLIIHEQNAIAGLTNKWLSKIAVRKLSGFPVAVGIDDPEWIGNPVREDILTITEPRERLGNRGRTIRVLVVGGSQGARVFNQSLPKLLGQLKDTQIDVWHQSGESAAGEIGDAYLENNLTSQVNEFIDDMAEAYTWSDVVICRAGAMTVAEICAAGAVAIFVPYPSAVNDHQTKNAEYLVSEGAAISISESEFVSGQWLESFSRIVNDREELVKMAEASRRLSKPQSTQAAVEYCEAILNA